MNLARLNHILIPSTRAERDRFRKSVFGRITRPLASTYFALTEPGRVLIVLCMFIAVAGVDIEVSDVYLLWSVLTGLLVASFLLRPLFGTRGLQIALRCSPHVAAGAPLRFTLTVKNDGARTYSALTPRPPFLPWDGKWQGPPPEVQGLAPGESVRFESTARFIQRGEHDIDSFQIAAVVPMGLAIGPCLPSPGARFLVVPTLANIIELEAPRTGRGDPQGTANAGALGDAQELYGVRDYVRGDRVRDLHARTWARTGRPHVRQYRQQHSAHIAVLLALHRQGLSERQLEASIMLTAGLVGFLIRGETLIDLVVPGLDARVLTVGRGFGTLHQALEALALAAPRSSETNEEWERCLVPIQDRASRLLAVTQDASAWSTSIDRWALERGMPRRIFEVTDTLGRFARRKSAGGEVAPMPAGAVLKVATTTILERKPLRL